MSASALDRFRQRAEARRALNAAFGAAPEPKGLNGTEAANRAVAAAAPDSTVIFLTRSEYQDLIYRAGVAELKSYKGKRIFIVSDAPEAS